MTEKRHASRKTGTPVHLGPTMPPPTLVLIAGVVCDVCRWPDRCRFDGLCWIAEKAAIAAEKGYG